MAQISVGCLGLKLSKNEIVDQIAELLGRQLDIYQTPESSWSIFDFDLSVNNTIYDANSSLARVLTNDPVLVELLKLAEKLKGLHLKNE